MTHGIALLIIVVLNLCVFAPFIIVKFYESFLMQILSAAVVGTVEILALGMIR